MYQYIYQYSYFSINQLFDFTADVSLKFTEEDTYVVNTVYQTSPSVIHGNGPAKILLNSVGNYIAKSWTHDEGCSACREEVFDLGVLSVRNYCLILLLRFG